MENTTERKRRSKGSLSVLDEFTGDAGEITFAPKISGQLQKQIDDKTRLADMPRPTLPHPHSQTEVELAENLGQTSDNPKTEPRTIVGQSSDKLRTNLGHGVAKKLETSDNPKTEPRTKPRTIVGQSSDKLRTTSAFQGLSGLQKNIVILLYEICRTKGGLVTGPVSIEHLYLKLESTRLSVQKSIQRLEQKMIIVRKEFRSGRGGWTVYELPKDVWSEILQMETSDKLRTNLGQSSDNPKTEPKTEPRTTASSSSRELYLNKSTTTGDVGSLKFNLESVAEFGITESAVARCFELYPLIDREKIQDLINRFAQFMRTGDGKRVQNARGFFISLAEQLSKGITPLDHIETPETRLMRELVEKKRQQKSEEERLAKEMRDFDFEDWWDGLSQESRDALVKPSGISPSGSQSQKMLAKQIHAEKFWPDRKKKALAESVAGV